jgi:hypothetical protein
MDETRKFSQKENPLTVEMLVNGPIRDVLKDQHPYERLLLGTIPD